MRTGVSPLCVCQSILRGGHLMVWWRLVFSVFISAIFSCGTAPTSERARLAPACAAASQACQGLDQLAFFSETGQKAKEEDQASFGAFTKSSYLELGRSANLHTSSSHHDMVLQSMRSAEWATPGPMQSVQAALGRCLGASKEKEQKQKQVSEICEREIIREDTTGRRVAGIPREGPMDTVNSNALHWIQDRYSDDKRGEGHAVAAATCSPTSATSAKGGRGSLPFSRGAEASGAPTWVKWYGNGPASTDGATTTGPRTEGAARPFSQGPVTWPPQPAQSVEAASGECCQTYQRFGQRMECIHGTNYDSSERACSPLSGVSLRSARGLQPKVSGIALVDRSFSSFKEFDRPDRAKLPCGGHANSVSAASRSAELPRRGQSGTWPRRGDGFHRLNGLAHGGGGALGRSRGFEGQRSQEGIPCNEAFQISSFAYRCGKDASETQGRERAEQRGKNRQVIGLQAQTDRVASSHILLSNPFSFVMESLRHFWDDLKQECFPWMFHLDRNMSDGEDVGMALLRGCMEANVDLHGHQGDGTNVTCVPEIDEEGVASLYSAGVCSQSTKWCYDTPWCSATEVSEDGHLRAGCAEAMSSEVDMVGPFVTPSLPVGCEEEGPSALHHDNQWSLFAGHSVEPNTTNHAREIRSCRDVYCSSDDRASGRTEDNMDLCGRFVSSGHDFTPCNVSCHDAGGHHMAEGNDHLRLNPFSWGSEIDWLHCSYTWCKTGSENIQKCLEDDLDLCGCTEGQTTFSNVEIEFEPAEAIVGSSLCNAEGKTDHRRCGGGQPVLLSNVHALLDNEFEPSSFLNGASCDGDGDMQLRLKDMKRSKQRKERQTQIRFAEICEVVCFDHQKSCSFLVHERDREDCLRNLWHMHGQIATLQECEAALDSYVKQTPRNSQFGDHLDQIDGMQEVESNKDSFCKEAFHEMSNKVSSLHVSSSRPVFVDTWFLAAQRIDLCVRPRAVRIEQDIDFETFKRACRQTWFDLDDGRPIQLIHVQTENRRLPSVIDAWIVVQGTISDQTAALFHCESMPVFTRTRAALFANGKTVKHIFEILQHEDACRHVHAACFLQYVQGEEVVTRTNSESVYASSGTFFQGGLPVIERHVANMNENADADDSPSSSEATTAIPEDEVLEDHEESSLMSGGPIMMQIDQFIPDDWQVEGQNGAQALLEDEQATSIVFAPHHINHIQDHIELIRNDLPADQMNDRWTVVTFGLGLVELGRRDASFNPQEPNELMRVVLDLWDDHAQQGDLIAYNVSPQPMDIAGEKSIVLSVEIDIEGTHDERLQPVLVHERAVPEVTVRNRHYASRLYLESTMTEIFTQLGLQQNCLPLTARDCGVRLGEVSLEDGHRYDFDPGMLCLVWIGPIRDEVRRASETVGQVQAFFLQWRSLLNLQPDCEDIVLIVHGISPLGRPLGQREIVCKADQMTNLEWIDLMKQMWPFDTQHVQIGFVPDMTADVREIVRPCFHFVISYAQGDGCPVLIHQQIGVAENLPGQEGIVNEFWAVNMPNQMVSHSMPGVALGRPSWFRVARQQHIHPHVFIGGQKAREVRRHWQKGDLVMARYVVWQRHHALTFLLSDDETADHDELEMTSLIQRRVNLQKRSELAVEEDCQMAAKEQNKMRQNTVFGEICQAVCKRKDEDRHGKHACHGMHEHNLQYDEMPNGKCAHGEHRLPLLHGCGGGNLDPISPRGQIRDNAAESNRDALDDLESRIAGVLAPDWQGLNTDFAVLPSMHPFAMIACQWTQECDDVKGIFHVFTDGSMRQGKAAWAFVVICEQKVNGKTHFVRVGYAADRVNSDIGPCEQSAQDAEATALIAAAEYLLSRTDSGELEVHLHFDAKSVGFGSTGDTNVVVSQYGSSVRQRAARIMLSLVQRRSQQWKACHVHAHQGHPWNEFVDSIAGLVTTGWKPQRQAVLRSGSLLEHKLAEWAWMQICPTTEMPALQEVLANRKSQPHLGKIDTTLCSRDDPTSVNAWNGKIVFASANVGTLEQNMKIPGASVTYKAAELMQQFINEGVTIIGVQETRARTSGLHSHGPFTCLVSAGNNGQAGVELWINGAELSRELGIDFDPRQDVGIFHSDERLLAAKCHFGRTIVVVIVAYAPQRGREEMEIVSWWQSMRELLQKVDREVPCVVLGDLNCRVGSVESDFIGGAGADFEDLAGEKLRQICHDFELMIPATLHEFHEGQSWTHISPNGSMNRLDYILVSDKCRDSVTSSSVATDIDLLNGERDHQVVRMEMEVQVSMDSRCTVRNMKLYDREAARRCKHEGNHNMLESMVQCEWSCEVNTHWAHIREHVQQECPRWFPTCKRAKRQVYFSDNTWNMICHRKDLRQEHRRLQRERNERYMAFFFQRWKGQVCTEEEVDSWHLANHLGTMQEAVLLEARRTVDSQFRSAKRREWKQWVKDRLQDTVSKLQHAKASDIYKILQPKKMVDKKKGKKGKPLPGLQDAEGVWRTSRQDVALAWQKQFADIENAKHVDFCRLMENSFQTCGEISVDQLMQIPTLYDLEAAIRAMNDRKAPGVDGIGAEVWQMQVATSAARLFPLFLKSAVRRQAVVEHTGGWILPLFKGKGSPSKMSGYRAILLEPTLGRIFSKTWRPAIVDGLSKVAEPMQWGGRRGLGIEPLHLHVRMWQAEAKHCGSSLALLFIDLRTAFYSIVKPMLAGIDGTMESVVAIFQTLKLPNSAFNDFVANIVEGGLVQKATQSAMTAENVRANLANT